MGAPRPPRQKTCPSRKALRLQRQGSHLPGRSPLFPALSSPRVARSSPLPLPPRLADLPFPALTHRHHFSAQLDVHTRALLPQRRHSVRVQARGRGDDGHGDLRRLHAAAGLPLHAGGMRLRDAANHAQGVGPAVRSSHES